MITEALESFGRSGVPLYVLYNGKSGTLQMLPELLNPGIALDALDMVAAGASGGLVGCGFVGDRVCLM